MTLILAGDLGGTNIRYKLIQTNNSSETVLKSLVYSTLNYRDNLITSIKDFLSDQQLPQIAVLGISGIIKNNKIKASLAFGPGLDDIRISEETGIPKVFLINDLEAFGYGIFSLKEQDFIEINDGYKDLNAPIVCISIGTGINHCYLLKNSSFYKVYPAEGGFQDYSPKTPEEKSIYSIISKKYKTGVSYSALLSGNNSLIIYNCLKEDHKKPINKEFEKTLNENYHNELKFMMEAGFNNTDDLAFEAINIWQNILGHLIANLAVNFLPFGGVYIGGGVITKNFERIRRSSKIIEGIYNATPAVLHDILRQIPVFILNSDDLSINGSINFAKQTLSGYI